MSTYTQLSFRKIARHSSGTSVFQCDSQETDVCLQFKSLDDLNVSSAVFYQHMTQPKDKTEVNNYGSDYVDVRDVADAVVATLKTEAASGQRLILDAGVYIIQFL